MFSANLGFVLDGCPDVELVGLKVPWCPQPATFAPLPWEAGVSGKRCPSISFVVGVPPTLATTVRGCLCGSGVFRDPVQTHPAHGRFPKSSPQRDLERPVMST